MKVTVDSGRCMGHGQCYSWGPEVYQSDDQGYCVVPVAEITGDRVAQAIAGAEACPESAITIDDSTMAAVQEVR